ncbi:hypothetical protein [Thermodesulfatator autotrophicus]|uniref:Fimbrial assembly protein n=1 Tax=Thermodesulfatator autotrophicus TaxID=1795632 RepID=A0A177E9M2_9BACT|nr:hypothetical protein [Thermodesulfatator autotrophicus]OAG28211.1 hypothetical protein TH606_02880 [Thermodesulfatator autotrophicus]
MITAKLALLKEWFRPASLGIYFDGEHTHLAEDNFHPGRRPARVFIAVSHGLLFFHNFKLPAQLGKKAIISAVRLEAQRLFTLLEKKTTAKLSCAVYRRKPGEVGIVFQERSFFQDIFDHLSPGLIPCGVVPAGVALLSFYYHQNQKLPPGLYYVKTDNTYEGIVIDEHGIKDIMPASPGTARAYLEEFSGEIFTFEGPAEKIIAEGARYLPALPANYFLSFEDFPLKPRPKLSLAFVLLCLLPLIFLTTGNLLQKKADDLETKIKEADQKIHSLKLSLAEIEAVEKRKEVYQKIEGTFKSWQNDKLDFLKILERITEILPEDTWVRRLEFRPPDEIRLWAEGKNALEVLELFADDPMFKEAKFLSNVTKNTRTGKEIFSIVMKIISKEDKE